MNKEISVHPHQKVSNYKKLYHCPILLKIFNSLITFFDDYTLFNNDIMELSLLPILSLPIVLKNLLCHLIVVVDKADGQLYHKP